LKKSTSPLAFNEKQLFFLQNNRKIFGKGVSSYDPLLWAPKKPLPGPEKKFPGKDIFLFLKILV